MAFPSSRRRPILLSAISLLALVVAGSRAFPRGQERTIRFGDVVLSGFQTAEFEVGRMAKAAGPDTTVDAVDPKQNSKAKLRARILTAYAVPKAANQVERIEAVGNVRFEGSRPAAESGVQSVRATGSKGTYLKQKRHLTLEGPVTFHADQPTADGKGREAVTGTAERATYDEAARTLTLTGSVQATVVTPDTAAEGSSFSGDEVRIDMAVRPYKVFVNNPSLQGKVNIRLNETEPKKGK
jgi:lipopolysaccharide export system protein LptA